MVADIEDYVLALKASTSTKNRIIDTLREAFAEAGRRIRETGRLFFPRGPGTIFNIISSFIILRMDRFVCLPIGADEGMLKVWQERPGLYRLDPISRQQNHPITASSSQTTPTVKDASTEKIVPVSLCENRFALVLMVFFQRRSYNIITFMSDRPDERVQAPGERRMAAALPPAAERRLRRQRKDQ